MVPHTCEGVEMPAGVSTPTMAILANFCDKAIMCTCAYTRVGIFMALCMIKKDSSGMLYEYPQLDYYKAHNQIV